MSGPILNKLLRNEREYGPLPPKTDSGKGPWRHWRLAYDDNDVAWLLFDKQEAPVNVLAEDVLGELGEALDQAGRDLPRGLVLRSGKESFCVGADIHEFRDLGEEEEIIARLQRAHATVNRLEAMTVPTVSIIHGSCLGGGLELTLCCDYRLALPDARLGLPEVMLGLHPGLGGTARLTRLVDPVKAMSMMLTGKTLDARRAKALGLVDKVIEERHVLRAVDAIMNGAFKPHDTGLKERLMTTAPARRLEARQMRAKTAEKVRLDHYPAPGALIELWEEHGDNPADMRQAEIESFAGLLKSPAAQNLISVFMARESMKRTTRRDVERVRHVHVVGAGSMGGDIAGWCALQGLRVTLFDTSVEMIARAVKQTVALCDRKHLSASETRGVLDRLIPDTRSLGVRHADLIIEAVPEDIEIKRSVYARLEPEMKSGAVLATNTSSIPLEELSRNLAEPGRFVGLHFFNPVAKMQLVEVVGQPAASQVTLDRAHAFVGQIDRLPVTVSSSPGFLVNRALTPYLLEAIQMVEEGLEPEAVDRAAEEFGMPMGPVELADKVGLDICLAVADMLRERLDISMATVPDRLREWVDQGRTGAKSGRGFYAWKDGKPQKNRADAAIEPEHSDRLVLPMLNTCVACLREGVVDDPDMLDGAMIFGTGFAPFRGGPLHYARTRGVEEIVAQLGTFAEQHGERFAPDAGWRELQDNTETGEE